MLSYLGLSRRSHSVSLMFCELSLSRVLFSSDFIKFPKFGVCFFSPLLQIAKAHECICSLIQTQWKKESWSDPALLLRFLIACCLNQSAFMLTCTLIICKKEEMEIAVCTGLWSCSNLYKLEIILWWINISVYLNAQ